MLFQHVQFRLVRRVQQSVSTEALLYQYARAARGAVSGR